MTTLRFVGDLPMWIGMLLALIVAVMSWRYYRRESIELPRRLRWFLPLLRSLAFFLGVMVLTGPVLHHKTIIGQLGSVQVYLDSSASMTMSDKHMSAGRKLLVAEHLGWLVEGKVDATLLNAADALARAQTNVGRVSSPVHDQSKTGEDTRPTTRAKAEEFLRELNTIEAQLPAPQRQQLTSEVVEPLRTLIEDENDEDAVATLSNILAASETVEASLRASFEQVALEMIASGDERIDTALTMFDETPRWRRSEVALSETASNVLSQLQEEHDVEVIMLQGIETVSKTLSEQDSESAADNSFLNKADAADKNARTLFSQITDLSTGIVATQQHTASPLDAATPTGSTGKAIVLLTDGQHNSGPSPLQTARVLGSQGVEFYCVSVGATEQAADLAVIGLEYPESVFQKDRVRGAMTIRDRMPAGKSFVAQVRYQDDVVWQQQLTTQAIDERRVEFEFSVDKLVQEVGAQFASDTKQHAVPLAFQASINPLADETETSNNYRDFRLAAITDHNKVLLLDGRSRWETRYLRNAFSRDQQWQVDTVIAGPGTDEETIPRGEHKDQFPTDRDALFDYDMIVFGEVAPDLFQEHELEWIKEFVAIRGGGIVFIDGQRGRLRQLTDQSLRTLLPVEWLPNVASTKATSLHLTDQGASYAGLKLALDEQKNSRFWSELPPPHSFLAVEALPDAETLVEISVADNRFPAIVTRPFGAGRVLYMAFDETWRWRYKAADTWHQRIWNQLARFVMPRPFAVSDEFVSIDSGPVSYDAGKAIDLRVRLLGLDGKPAIGATADALIWNNGRVVSTVSLKADEEVPGIYRGRYEGPTEGEYEVSVRASGYSESALKARTQFVVLPPESGEMAQTAANETLLQQMATTSAGAFLREEDLGRLPELLRPLSSGRVVESDTLIWESYWWFSAIIILMTIEWTFRKRAGLL